VYRLAVRCGLTGSVRNTQDGVEILVYGDPEAIDWFKKGLAGDPPPLAMIAEVREASLDSGDPPDSFRILESSGGDRHQTLISPDTATCPDCLREIFDPGDRRCGYPFTNCTNCGPRYTITAKVPYDRPNTSMACFPMCEACSAEYENPENRRFHAQPNACPDCGPHVWTGSSGPERICGSGALRLAARDLSLGRILALKGLGGFHLACAATDDRAVATLRSRKKRESKPLAVMVPDLDAARCFAQVSGKEADLLAGNQRPIVLLRPRSGSTLSGLIAPDTHVTGLMLPYTPLHHLLLAEYRKCLGPGLPPALVMTSGNRSAEPIALGNREAAKRLAGLADRFLFHNRDILIRCDDSVLRVLPSSEETLFYRRARGFVPSPVPMPVAGPSIQGMGAESKATLCLTKDDQAFVSQHIGDLDNPETADFHRETAEHLQRILRVEPKLLVADLHPDYASTQSATGQHRIPVARLQHHFAHIHAVLAENGRREPALGIALDGTGLGEDGTLWGGEFLLVDPARLEQGRLARFSLVPLPGGEAAVREPWRTAQSYLYAIGVREASGRPWPWSEGFGRASGFVDGMLQRRVNSPLTSSCGRLFDAVSALLGLCLSVTYEGQAAVLLEAIQDPAEKGSYPCHLRQKGDMWVLDTLELFRAAHRDWMRLTPAAAISRRFHLGLCNGIVSAALRLLRACGLNTVALSGGVLQNATLAVELPLMLRRSGVRVLTHTALPPGDACIALGQAAFGAYRATS
jgi:hydrogenase maturation protein HypF